MHTRILQTLFCILISFGIASGATFKIYGLDYTARRINYCPSQAQVNQDMQIIDSRAYYVRLYSLVDCNQGAMVLEAIKQLNLPLRVTFGIWLDIYFYAEFPNEYAALVNIKNAYGLSKVDHVIVGSETQYRGDFSVDLLISYISNISTTVKQEFGYPQIQITTADVIDSIRGLPQLIAAVDYVTYNQFAYWENIAIDDAITRTEFRYNDFVNANVAQGKKIVISEVGWPTTGENEGNAVPTPANANKFFQEIVCWSAQNNVQIYYFAAFDSLWQQDDDQKHWGLYNEDRSLKDGISFEFPCSAPASGATTGTQATPNPTRATSSTKATVATTGSVNSASTNKATTTGKASTNLVSSSSSISSNKATSTGKVASSSSSISSSKATTTAKAASSIGSSTKASSATVGSSTRASSSASSSTTGFNTCSACGAAACCQTSASGAPACYDPNVHSCINTGNGNVLCGSTTHNGQKYFEGTCNGGCYDSFCYTCSNNALSPSGKC